MTTTENLDLRHLLPLANENRWTDLLATFIEADPAPFARLLDLPADLQVRREAFVATGGRKSDRLDLLLRSAGGTNVAVIEAKLLSDLGAGQLDRYVRSFPGAQTYRVLHLANFPVGGTAPEPWVSLTWERVVGVYAESENAWVRATAQAWRAWLASIVPSVNEATVWNDVPDDAASFELALRARAAWLHSRLDDLAVDHDLRNSAAGGSWVVRMWAPSSIHGHRAQCEMEEGLTAQEWRPIPGSPYRDRLKGPSVWIGLLQSGVPDSTSFDWGHLIRTFKATVLNEDGSPRPTPSRAWQTTAPRLEATDRQRRDAAAADDPIPPWIGKGFGMRQALKVGECMFGARFSLPPTSTLGEVLAELRRSEDLVRAMAEVHPGRRGPTAAT